MFVILFFYSFRFIARYINVQKRKKEEEECDQSTTVWDITHRTTTTATRKYVVHGHKLMYTDWLRMWRNEKNNRSNEEIRWWIDAKKNEWVKGKRKERTKIRKKKNQWEEFCLSNTKTTTTTTTTITAVTTILSCLLSFYIEVQGNSTLNTK